MVIWKAVFHSPAADGIDTRLGEEFAQPGHRDLAQMMMIAAMTQSDVAGLDQHTSTAAIMILSAIGSRKMLSLIPSPAPVRDNRRDNRHAGDNNRGKAA